MAAALVACCLALPPPASAADVPLSELLEKGIYTQETRGDLASAIAIYQQVLADAKTKQSIAAQAQFRLAQCFLQQNRQDEAEAAFAKLIRDFPQEKELIAKARQHLSAELALLPVPWVDGERLQMTIALPTGVDIGTMEYRADLVETAGRKLWRVGSRLHAGADSLSIVEVEPESFTPVTSYWKHGLLGEVSAVYHGSDRVEMQRAGAEKPLSVPLDKQVFDNEQALHLMRRLPLQVGYKTTLQVFSTLGGGVAIPLGIEVLKKEVIETPAGKFDCFRVELSVNQTFWISDDAHRYVAKFDAPGVVASLTSISQRKAGAPVHFKDAELGVSFTAPADWVIHKRKSSTPADHLTIHLLDPKAVADAVQFRIYQTDALPAPARQSARAWIEADLTGAFAKRLKDVTVRPDSWRTQNLGGRLAVSCLADYTERDRAMVLYCLAMQGQKTSEQFMLACPADQLDALKPALDSIIASYQVK